MVILTEAGMADARLLRCKRVGRKEDELRGGLRSDDAVQCYYLSKGVP
jgi:hypothetical protein